MIIAPQSKRSIWWLLPLLIATLIIVKRNRETSVYHSNHGLVFGTVYRLAYQHTEDLKEEVEALFATFNESLSPFSPTSIISRVNRNEAVQPDSYFIKVFEESERISRLTDGAFDITIAPLANAWGFGFKKSEWVDSLVVDSLLQFTGYEKIKLQNGKVVKSDPRIMISCSAIAKGYASDVIAGFFSSKGIKNYMVEIGGEIVVKGVNPQQEAWKIGINKPEDDSLSVNNELKAIIQLTDAALATSGNYRNYYYKEGVKYAHTIDPRTGYPVQQDILSATVVTKDCLTADALATAFMVMGYRQSIAFLEENRDVEAYLIYLDEAGKRRDYCTEGLKGRLTLL